MSLSIEQHVQAVERAAAEFDACARAAERAAARARHMTAVGRAVRDLEEAASLVVGLAALREPSVNRPWREPALSSERRAELDYAARIEQEERAEDAPGAHPDACRADVLDALSGVLCRAEDLAWHMSRAAHRDPIPAAAGDADPRPYLLRAAECVPLAVLIWANGAEIAHYAADRAALILAELGHALALAVDGQALAMVCPWCKGRTATAPIGGDRTLRVRVLPGGEPAIVCESGTCNPPNKDVTSWWGGCPVWPFRDWRWLAKRLTHLDRRTVRAAPDVALARDLGSTGRAGSVVDVSAISALLEGLVWEPGDARWPGAGGSMAS